MIRQLVFRFARPLIAAVIAVAASTVPAAAQTQYVYLDGTYSSGGSLAYRIIRLTAPSGGGYILPYIMAGNTTGWPAPRPLRLPRDGTSLCTSDSAGIACYNTADLQTISPRIFIPSTVVGPYGWDITQDGKTLLAAITTTDAGSGASVRGLRLVDMASGQALGQLALQVYAVATSPDSQTATLLALDPTEITAIAQGLLPFNLVKVDIATRTVTSTVALRDQAGTRINGPWTLYGLADTGSDLVIWNGDATAAVRVFSAAGVLQRQIAAPAANVLVLSADSTQAFVANGIKAQRLDLITGAIVDYTQSNGYPTTSLALTADGKSLRTLGTAVTSPSTVLPSVQTWTIATDTVNQSAGLITSTSSGPVTTIGAVPPLRLPQPPQTGWWWDPTRSGAFYAIEVQDGGKAYIGTFSYDTDGRATWFVTSCTQDLRNVCEGRLDQFGDGTTIDGTYRPAAYRGSPGSIAITATARDRATVTMQGQTREIFRFPIDQAVGVAGGPSWVPRSGWWWDATRPGIGWFLESQGTTTQGTATYTNMFLVGQMYRNDGSAVWYSSGSLYGRLPTGGTAIPFYQGQLSEFAGGPPYTGGAGTGLVLAGSPGYVTLQFLSQTRGVLTLPNGRNIVLTRFVLP